MFYLKYNQVNYNFLGLFSCKEPYFLYESHANIVFSARLLSFLSSCGSENIKYRYNDIGEYGFAAAERSGPMKVDSSKQKEMSILQNTSHAGRPAGLGG